MSFLFLLACTPPDGGLDVALAEVETVLRVRWRTAAPSRATVTGTFGDTTVAHTESAETTHHDIVLAGFPARTEVTVRVPLPDGEAEATITTGTLPTWLPDVTYAATVPEAAEGGYTVASVIDTGGGRLVVYDGAGRPVWAYEPTGVVPPAISRARMSLDGTAILYDVFANAVDGPGYIVRVPLDGGAATRLAITAAHTDFVELPSGGYATLAWELRMFGDRQIVAGTVVEVPADGEPYTVWSAFDDFTPDLTQTYETFIPGTPEAEDWTHINGLDYDADTDAYYVSLARQDTVARIDRATGELAWWLSDSGGDFTPVGDAPLVLHPHSVQATPDGILVFNRGNPNEPDTCSSAVDVALDEADGTAAITASYTSERCLLVTFLGSAERLPGGNTLVSWSTAGQLDEFTPDGALAWRVSAPLGFGFGFASRVDALGPPG